MKISERIELTIDRWSEKWKDKLRGWVLRSLAEGAKKFLEDDEPAAIDNVQEMIARIQANPNTSPELKAILTRLEGGGSWFMIVMAVVMSVQAIIGLVTTLWQPSMKVASYTEERVAKTFRFDPGAVITAWRRDKPAYEKLFDDLKDQGWSDERIEALKFVTLFMPSASDIVSWYAREVYEPDMIDRYGLDDELPAYEGTDFPKIGVDAKQAKNYWMAHWVHASYMQIREMLHRGVLSLDKTMPAPPTTEAGWKARDAEGTKAAYDWYRVVEISTFWRARLTEMMWEIPTRVDVRRFWDMRTIDEERLRSIYHSRGYHGKDLDDYILWTKVYVAFPDLIARWKNGWITEDDVRSELTGLGMPADRVEEMIQTKIKPMQPARVEGERTATATEIMKAVKKEYISWAEGVERLQRMGYGISEAEFKLNVYIGVTEGSPESYIEFVDMTERYRKAMGLDAKVPSTELLEAGKALAEARKAEAEAREKELKDEKLAPYLKAISDAEYRYRQLLVQWQAKTK